MAQIFACFIEKHAYKGDKTSTVENRMTFDPKFFSSSVVDILVYLCNPNHRHASTHCLHMMPQLAVHSLDYISYNFATVQSLMIYIHQSFLACVFL